MLQELTAANLAKLDAATVERQVRQFGCEPCGQRTWWKKVPVRKPVSRCKLCRTRYDPVPVEEEWGFGTFRCHKCSWVWTNRKAKRDIRQECSRCHAMVVCASMRPRAPASSARRTAYRHSCAGCATGACRHRFTASEPHDSTGSTNSDLSVASVGSVYGDGSRQHADGMEEFNLVFARLAIC